MKKTLLLFIVASTLLISSCKKDPGTGGNSSINGKIFVKDYNNTFTTLLSQYYGSDIYVYIIYGNNIDYGQRIKTNFEGAFEFKYLRPGKYTIYTYSKDSTLQAPNGKIPILKEVSISHRKQNISLEDMVIFN